MHETAKGVGHEENDQLTIIGFVPDEDLRGQNVVLLQSTVREMLDITTDI